MRTLSVIIPAVNTRADLIDCLEHLEEQKKDVELQTLVVNRLGAEVGRHIRDTFADVKVFDVDTSTTIPEMRAIGFDNATADAIAVIEDHVMTPPGWAKAMLDALDDNDADVVAGSVENAATHTQLDWACFLLEYSHLIPPIPEGKVDSVTGNNVVYRRRVIEANREAVHAGKWENHLHETLKAQGVDLICRPEIVVGHKKHYTFQEYLTQRYYYARSYAGARVQGKSPVHKLAYGVGSLALPPLLMQRTMTRLLSKKKHTKLLLKSTPAIGVFIMSWAIGEAVGSVAGAGDSLSKVC